MHCVAVDEDVEARVFAAGELDALASWAANADVIAIDAPAQLSQAPHADDETLSPKFRHARCAEIALGREHGIWVPWTSPAGPPVPGWMATGFELFATLPGELLEVYPYGGFRVLAHPLAKKTTAAGARQRLDALRTAGLTIGDLRSHDLIDAALAALVALQRRSGTAVPVTCGHDGSAIWLPAGTRARG